MLIKKKTNQKQTQTRNKLMICFYEHIFVLYMYFGILSEMEPDLIFSKRQSDIVMNGSCSTSNLKEMKLKCCLKYCLS